jgi:hypothetical protein
MTRARMRFSRRARSFAIATIAFSLLACAPATFGQRTFRNLTGTVTDRHHEPLKGAVVEVDNGDTERVASYITGRNGLYSFKRLDGDTDYRVWATYRRHRSRTKNISSFDSSSAKVINLVIKMQ